MSDDTSGEQGLAATSLRGRLCVFEQQVSEGETQRTWLLSEPLALQRDDERPRLLPPNCLGRVFERYGRLFDEAELAQSSRQLEWTGELALPQGNIRRFRHRSWFDVVARDFLVYSGPLPGSAADQQGPRFDLCTSVAAALNHLAAAYASARASSV